MDEMWITLSEMIPQGSVGWHEGGSCTESIELLKLVSRGTNDLVRCHEYMHRRHANQSASGTEGSVID